MYILSLRIIFFSVQFREIISFSMMSKKIETVTNAELKLILEELLLTDFYFPGIYLDQKVHLENFSTIAFQPAVS
jgi:hypothetical protein